MEIEFDHSKNEENIAKHGLSLGRASDLDILAFIEDDRNAYGDVRYRAWGLIDGKVHCLAFTWRNGRVWAISLRRAHKKEFDRYVPKSVDR